MASPLRPYRLLPRESPLIAGIGTTTSAPATQQRVPRADRLGAQTPVATIHRGTATRTTTAIRGTASVPQSMPVAFPGSATALISATWTNATGQILPTRAATICGRGGIGGQRGLLVAPVRAGPRAHPRTHRRDSAAFQASRAGGRHPTAVSPPPAVRRPGAPWLVANNYGIRCRTNTGWRAPRHGLALMCRPGGM